MEQGGIGLGITPEFRDQARQALRLQVALKFPLFFGLDEAGVKKTKEKLTELKKQIDKMDKNVPR